MKVFKSLKAKVALLGVCVALACGFSGAAYASSHNFGNTLPGFQENVTVQAGTRTSGSASASVSVSSGGTRKCWLWCDAPSVGTRLTDSVLVTGNNQYTLSYYNRNSGNVYLRGCTDGWQDPNYISGYVSF